MVYMKQPYYSGILNADPEYKLGSKFSMCNGRTDQLQMTDPRDDRVKIRGGEVEKQFIFRQSK